MATDSPVRPTVGLNGVWAIVVAVLLLILAAFVLYLL
jgi:capsular polysaccharide biosynthesis protein